MIRSNRESGFGGYDIMLIPRPQKGRQSAGYGSGIQVL